MTIQNETRTTLYAVSYAPATDNGGVGGFDWFYEQDENEALIHYGRMVATCGDESIVRLVPVPWCYHDGFDPEDITEYLDSPEGLDMIEIKYRAMYENIPNTVDDVDRLPIHARTPENVNMALKNKGFAPEDVISKTAQDESDIEPLKSALATMMELNDDFLGDINNEYVRGQIEFIAHSPSIKTDSETVEEMFIEIIKNISGYEIK